MNLKRIPPPLGHLEEEIPRSVPGAGSVGGAGGERDAEVTSAEVDGFPTRVGHFEAVAAGGTEERAGILRATGILEPVAAVADGEAGVGIFVGPVCVIGVIRVIDFSVAA